MRRIELAGGDFTLVDDSDFDALNKWKWYRGGGKKGYPARSLRIKEKGIVKKTTLFMHRAIMCPPKGMVVDHKNGDVLDNQRINLRVCTYQQNEYNKSSTKRGTSRYKGVSWNTEIGKWVVLIRLQGKDKYLGAFISEETAALAYNKEAEANHGEFVRLNIISKAELL